MNIATLYLATVIAVYRLTRFGVKDDFPPVLWLRDRLAGGWRPMTDREMHEMVPNPFPATETMVSADGTHMRYVRRAAWSPYWLAELISCPWCLSGWLSGAVVALLDLNQSVPDPVLFGFAVWGGAALLASRKWA